MKRIADIKSSRQKKKKKRIYRNVVGVNLNSKSRRKSLHDDAEAEHVKGGERKNMAEHLNGAKKKNEQSNGKKEILKKNS